MLIFSLIYTKWTTLWLCLCKSSRAQWNFWMPIVNFTRQLQFSFCPPGIVFTLPAKTIIMRSVAEISSRLKLGKKANYFKPSLCWTNLNFNAFFRKLDHFSSWIWRKFGFLCTFRAGIRLNLCKLSLKMYVFSSVKAILRLFYVEKRNKCV